MSTIERLVPETSDATTATVANSSGNAGLGEKMSIDVSRNPREGLAPWRFYMILALGFVTILINGEWKLFSRNTPRSYSFSNRN